MNLNQIIRASAKPKLYAKGTHFMWTDEYISKKLLQVHLNPDIDLASRKQSTIDSTVNWILNHFPRDQKLNILDLGCGVGHYSERFAEQGHQVTGVDISKTSVTYANEAASQKGVEIEYICADYTHLSLKEESFDLVVMIYTDFGVLVPSIREELLSKVHKSLKSDGLFIFDVLKNIDLENKATPKSWEASQGGFWNGSEYLALSESFIYEEASVILYQHLVLEVNDLKTYRFWTHFFHESELLDELERNGFRDITFRNDIIPKSDEWSGENVIFTVSNK